jgi:phytoene synthase
VIAALFGLDAALGRIALEIREPMAGLVRFQWWREALEAASDGRSGRQPHPFLGPLTGPLIVGRLSREGLADLLEAHEAMFEARRLPDAEEAVRFADRTGARVHAYTMMIVGGDGVWAERARGAGRALALLRLATRLPLYRDAGFALPRGLGPAEFARALAEAAGSDLEAAAEARPPRHLLAPMLALRLVRHRLRRLERAGHEPDRLAGLPPAFALPGLLLAGLLGRP